MIKIIIILLLSVTFTGFTKNDKTKKSNKKINKQNGLKEIIKSHPELDLISFDSKILDTFIESIKNNDTNKIWEIVDPEIQKLQSKEDIIRIFDLYNKYYGKINNFEQANYGTVKNAEWGQIANVEYKVNFDKYKGKSNGVFRVYDTNTVKMFSFNLELEDYTKVDTFDIIAKPFFDALKSKDKKQIYNLTSDRFKEYTSISDFESRIKKIIDIDFSNFKLFNSQIGIIDKNEVLELLYEINEKESIKLTLVKSKEKFELEGLNYIPNE